MVRIPDRDVEIAFEVGEDAVLQLNEDALRAGVQQMAAKINSVADWAPEEKAAFESMKKIVFFESSVLVNGYRMDRPCCDEDDAVFYWEASEFDMNTDADVRANTLFHDCWHVIQYKENRRYAQSDKERVAREIDAIAHQIEAARKLGCSQSEIAHLEDFKSDQHRIEVRLAEGVRALHGYA